MSKVRVHNFAVSLDGFATGEGQSLEAPFGHAGERLHEWYVSTQFSLEQSYDIEAVTSPSGITHLSFVKK